MHGRRSNYRGWDAQQCSQEPVAPRDALPEDDLVFCWILSRRSISRPSTSISPQELRGQPPFDVTMMVTLLVYAYSVESAPAEGWRPPASAIWPFEPLSVTIRLTSAQSAISARSTWRRFGPCSRPGLAGEMGMVKLGNLSTDGTKMGANASRHKAMSYGYMNKEIQRLKLRSSNCSSKPSSSTPSKTLRWEAVVATNCPTN